MSDYYMRDLLAELRKHLDEDGGEFFSKSDCEQVIDRDGKWVYPCEFISIEKANRLINESEIAKWKDEYLNLCKFVADLEAENKRLKDYQFQTKHVGANNVALLELLDKLASALERSQDWIAGEHKMPMYSEMMSDNEEALESYKAWKK